MGYVEPAVPADAVADPFWRDLHGAPLLPSAYMPAVMPGRRPLAVRVVALALVAVFLLAAGLGTCLTWT